MTDEPFVSRAFRVGSKEIQCSFWRPRPDQDDFVCEYKITFADKDRLHRAYGVDEIQALMLAMQKAHMDLLRSDDYQQRGLSWLGRRDLGLPLPENVNVSDFSNLPPGGS